MFQVFLTSKQNNVAQESDRREPGLLFRPLKSIHEQSWKNKPAPKGEKDSLIIPAVKEPLMFFLADISGRDTLQI